MSRPVDDSCWICGKFAKVKWHGADREILCDRCGHLYVPERVTTPRSPEELALLPFLAAHVRRTEVAGRRFEITAEWMVHARTYASGTIRERVRRLLEYLSNQGSFGQRLNVELELLVPWAGARDESEVRFLLQYLNELGYLKELDEFSIPSKDRRGGASGTAAHVSLSVAGWEALSPVAGAGVVGACFVAMSFHEDLTPAYENGMAPAIRECGFSVIRVDREEHNDQITDRILAGIRAAQFVVSDYTRHRPNVYYEAGFAAGLGRTVIGTCRANEFDGLHFDVRQRNIIKWTDAADLKRQLTDRIKATVTLPARLG